jgi:hypothetical protein
MSRRSALALLVAVALVGGCGFGKSRPPLEVGLKRIALDLAFEADKDGVKKKAPPQVAFTADVPVPGVSALQTNFTQDEVVGSRHPTPPVVHLDPCPKAPAGSVPEFQVQGQITRLPAEGRYTSQVKGTFELQSAVFPLKGPLPPVAYRYVRNARVLRGAPAAVTGAPSPDTMEYDVVDPGLLPNSSLTRHFRVTATDLLLVSQTSRVNGVDTTLTWQPPITIMKHGTTEGATWNSAGTDTDKRVAMVVQGKLDRHVTVDVCGTMYEAYRVVSTERVASLNGTAVYTSNTSDTSNTPGSTGPGKPNVYNVYTNAGGIFISEEQHTVTNVNSDIGPVTIIIDSTSTLMSIVPKAGP